MATPNELIANLEKLLADARRLAGVPINTKHRGKQPLTPGESSLPYTMRVTEEQKKKLVKLGGAKWIRNKIDKATPPGERKRAEQHNLPLTTD
jgi:hypothetical protein